MYYCYKRELEKKEWRKNDAVIKENDIAKRRNTYT